MKRSNAMLVAWLCCSMLAVDAAADKTRADSKWEVGDPILEPGPQGSFDEVAVKDPSIVFFDGAWHLFYTARSRKEYTTAYVTAAELSGLHNATRHELPMIRGAERYGCAPQVLFFEPQKKWYLIYQNRDAGYQPMFSTTGDLADPKSWGKPARLVSKDSPRKNPSDNNVPEVSLCSREDVVVPIAVKSIAADSN